MAKASDQKRQIKILLSEDDHDIVRLAAALNRTNMAEFCRDVVLDAARRLTKDIPLPKAGGKRKKGPS